MLNMANYLIINKGQKYYHSIGCWTESLATVKKRINEYEKRGLDVFVIEEKDYATDIRIKKRINGKWQNTKWINISDEIWAEQMYYYINDKDNMDKYIKFRQQEIDEYNDPPSIAEWILHNDWEKREFIYWLYENGKI